MERGGDRPALRPARVGDFNISRRSAGPDASTGVAERIRDLVTAGLAPRLNADRDLRSRPVS